MKLQRTVNTLSSHGSLYPAIEIQASIDVNLRLLGSHVFENVVLDVFAEAGSVLGAEMLEDGRIGIVGRRVGRHRHEGKILLLVVVGLRLGGTGLCGRVIGWCGAGRHNFCAEPVQPIR